MTAARASLHIPWGEGPRERRVIPAGGRVVVGRDSTCDVVCSRDPEMSDRHFTVEWDGARGLVHDAGSRRGTLVGGAPIEGPAEIRHRGWIRAGSTDFVFAVEMAPCPVAPARRATHDALAAIADAGRLWVIVDAARGDHALALLRASMDPGRSLYEGLQGDVLADVAPHLVHLEPSSRLLGALVERGPGFSLFVESSEDERALRRHFRRFLVVEAEGVGPRTYFRFYDPAVFATFWEMATAQQRADLTRAVDAFLIAGDEGLVRYAGPLRASSAG